MRKYPKFIETIDKTPLEIDHYSNGKFWINGNPPLVYDIEKGTFYKIIGGVEVKTDILPRDPKSHRTWLQQREKWLRV